MEYGYVLFLAGEFVLLVVGYKVLTQPVNTIGCINLDSKCMGFGAACCFASMVQGRFAPGCRRMWAGSAMDRFEQMDVASAALCEKQKADVVQEPDKDWKH